MSLKINLTVVETNLVKTVNPNMRFPYHLFIKTEKLKLQTTQAENA